MLSGPILVTENLILRPPAPEDFESFADMCSEADTMAHIGGTTPRAAAWRLWCTLAGAWHIRGYAMFSVIERSSGAWVGRLGPWYPDSWPAPEVGWGVRRAFAGKSYAYEGSVAAIDWVFDFLKWDQVTHCIAPDNIRSQRLAARLGSTNSGPTRLPEPFQDAPVDLWVQSAAEWKARRAR
jgi:RimJ/RimL family protein N-acetyltransferase